MPSFVLAQPDSRDTLPEAVPLPEHPLTIADLRDRLNRQQEESPFLSESERATIEQALAEIEAASESSAESAPESDDFGSGTP